MHAQSFVLLGSSKTAVFTCQHSKQVQQKHALCNQAEGKLAQTRVHTECTQSAKQTAYRCYRGLPDRVIDSNIGRGGDLALGGNMAVSLQPHLLITLLHIGGGNLPYID